MSLDFSMTPTTVSSPFFSFSLFIFYSCAPYLEYYRCRPFFLLFHVSIVFFLIQFCVFMTTRNEAPFLLFIQADVMTEKNRFQYPPLHLLLFLIIIFYSFFSAKFMGKQEAVARKKTQQKNNNFFSFSL